MKFPTTHNVLLIPLILYATFTHQAPATTASPSPDDGGTEPRHQGRRLEILTVATDRTDGFVRFERSCRVYNLTCTTLGMGQKWMGGNMAVGPGGGWKTNLLKTALDKMISKHGDDEEARNTLVMFTDSYDVIFTGTAEDIIEKYDDSGAMVLFGAEDFCWPDESLESSYPPPPIEKGLRFLCSGGFIGPAWALHDLLELGGRIKDTDDDQLYYTHLYLNEATREKFVMKLDHTASLFQNMNGERENIDIEIPTFDEDNEDAKDGNELEPYVLNKVHLTRPLVIHGNGPSKNHLLIMGNYLAKSWSTKTKSCISCLEDNLELNPSESLPIIVMGVFITDRTPDMKGFWNGILDLSYDKHRIDLVIFNAITMHGGSVYAHIIRNGKYYNSVKTLSLLEHNEQSARNAVLSQCRTDSDCDYVFFVDSDTRLTHPDTIQTLMSYNRPIVAPLLTRKNGWYSNFWGSISGSWHGPAFDHDKIVYREWRGLWNVPFVRSAMLINATSVLRNRKARPEYGMGWFTDVDMDFMASVRNEGTIFIYVSNLEEFGHLVEYLPEGVAEEKVPRPLPSSGPGTKDQSEAAPVSTGTPQQMKRTPRNVTPLSTAPESAVVNAVDGRQRRELAILTVATDRTAGYVRFERSCRAYGLSCTPLGMGMEWRGGDMANGPGGGWKTNLLRDALDEMLTDKNDSGSGNDEDTLVMFTDSYDVILTGTAEDILQRYDDSGATVLFGAEDFCWPNESLKSSYPPSPIKNGLKFLNSGGFVGPASALRAILDAGGDIQDGDDDQLYYTLIYLNDALRERFNMKLDHSASLFQNLNGQYDDVKIVFPPIVEGKDAPKLQEPYLLNKVHNTRPLVIHGNGPSKKYLLGLGNYLAKSWTVNGNSCLACSEDVLELDPSQPLPKIVVGIFVTERTRDMRGFWRNVTNLSYDKGSIDVVLYNQVPDHTQSMSRFLSRHGAEYNSVTVLSSKSVATLSEGVLHDERSARAFVVSHCESDPTCDYIFIVDADARLTNTFVIQTLIGHNRPIVAPLLVRTGWMFSNYWGALSPSGWYESAFDYEAIIYKERRGVWNVPFVRSAMLMNATSVIRNPKARPMYDLGRWEDVDMDFMQDVRDKGEVFAYVSNAAEFGYLVEEVKEGEEVNGEDPEEDDEEVEKTLPFDASGSVFKAAAAPMNAEECVPNQTCEEQETSLPIDTVGCVTHEKFRSRIEAALAEPDAVASWSPFRRVVDHAVPSDLARDAARILQTLPFFSRATGDPSSRNDGADEEDGRGTGASSSFATLDSSDLHGLVERDELLPEDWNVLMSVRGLALHASKKALGVCNLRPTVSRFTRMKTGGEVPVHVDNCHSVPVSERQKSLHECDPTVPRPNDEAYRIASSTLYLHSDGFNGGEFFFADPATSEPSMMVQPGSGRLVVYGAGMEGIHGTRKVLPRNDGGASERYALEIGYAGSVVDQYEHDAMTDNDDTETPEQNWRMDGTELLQVVREHVQDGTG